MFIIFCNTCYGLMACEADLSIGGLDGLCLCAEGFGNTGSHMLTITRGGKIIYHGSN